MWEAIYLSLKITIVSVFITTIIGTIIAHIFVKYDFRFKDIIETVIVHTIISICHIEV